LEAFMRRVLIGVVVVALAQPVGAQSQSNLDKHVEGELRIASSLLRPCYFGGAIDELGRKTHVLVGFESTPDCWLGASLVRSPSSTGTGGDSEDLTGLSPRQAFDRLITLMPAYSWKEMDGVVVVRPKAAWDDPKDPLNFAAKSFETTNEPLDDVLHIVLRAALVFHPHEDVRKSNPVVDRAVSVAFPGGTLLEAVNAMARARQDANWQIGYSTPDRPIVVLSIVDGHDGGVVMAPLAVPPAGR
jgi:hypothetical protein